LYLVLLTVVRVVRKGFCRGPEASDPEERALCSKALDEGAVILGVRTILSEQQKKAKINAQQVNVARGEQTGSSCPS
jgi:hypothetical protein